VILFWIVQPFLRNFCMFFRLFCFLAALMFLSCCKQSPVGPLPRKDEPDTVKSSVRAIINAPLMYNERWEFRNRDTLSGDTIGVLFPNGTTIRSGRVIRNSSFCLHYLPTNNSNSSLSINFKRVNNLEFQLSRDFYGRIDSLRYWDEQDLIFSFNIPDAIITPFETHTLRVFAWKQQLGYEAFTYRSAGGPPYISDFYSKLVEVISWNPPYASDGHDSSKVTAAQIIIDRFDRDKRRISGRFSFRVVGAIKKEVIDIQEGVFDNVQVYER
jgi:hypothetical protein